MNVWLLVVILRIAAWVKFCEADQLLTFLKLLFKQSGHYFTASKLPDLFIRTIVFIIVNRGAGRILKLER